MDRRTDADLFQKTERERERGALRLVAWVGHGASSAERAFASAAEIHARKPRLQVKEKIYIITLWKEEEEAK